MQYLRAVTCIGTKEKGQKKCTKQFVFMLRRMFCCVLVAIGMKLCGDRQVFLKLVAAWQVALFLLLPCAPAGLGTRQGTQPASDSLDSTQKKSWCSGSLPMLLSNTVITSALAHALAQAGTSSGACGSPKYIPPMPIHSLPTKLVRPWCRLLCENGSN